MGACTAAWIEGRQRQTPGRTSSRRPAGRPLARSRAVGSVRGGLEFAFTGPYEKPAGEERIHSIPRRGRRDKKASSAYARGTMLTGSNGWGWSATATGDNPIARFSVAGERRQTEPLDDPVVGVLGAWPSRQFSSDRYAKPPGPKAWAAFLFLDQISALSRYCFGRLCALASWQGRQKRLPQPI